MAWDDLCLRLLGVRGVLVLECGASAARVRTEGCESLPPTRPPPSLTASPVPPLHYTVSPTRPLPNLANWEVALVTPPPPKGCGNTSP